MSPIVAADFGRECGAACRMAVMVVPAAAVLLAIVTSLRFVIIVQPDAQKGHDVESVPSCTGAMAAKAASRVAQIRAPGAGGLARAMRRHYTRTLTGPWTRRKTLRRGSTAISRTWGTGSRGVMAAF